MTLVKVRGKLRDFWDKGEIKGDWLVYGAKKEKKRIKIGDNMVYRCFGVTVVDVDETSNAVSKTDYDAVSGFDAEKFEDLFTRALFRPTLDENKDRILIIMLVVVIAGLAINAFLIWGVSQQLSTIAQASFNSVL